MISSVVWLDITEPRENNEDTPILAIFTAKYSYSKGENCEIRASPVRPTLSSGNSESGKELEKRTENVESF